MLDITSLDLNGDEESSTQCADHGKLQHVGTNFPFLIQHGKMLSLASYRFQTMIYSSKSVIDLVVEMCDYHHCDPICKCLSISSATLHTTWGPCRMETTIGVLEPTTILASHL
jgi:hypothetical protein